MRKNYKRRKEIFDTITENYALLCAEELMNVDPEIKNEENQELILSVFDGSDQCKAIEDCFKQIYDAQWKIKMDKKDAKILAQIPEELDDELVDDDMLENSEEDPDFIIPDHVDVKDGALSESEVSFVASEKSEILILTDSEEETKEELKKLPIKTKERENLQYDGREGIQISKNGKVIYGNDKCRTVIYKWNHRYFCLDDKGYCEIEERLFGIYSESEEEKEEITNSLPLDFTKDDYNECIEKKKPKPKKKKEKSWEDECREEDERYEEENWNIINNEYVLKTIEKNYKIYEKDSNYYVKRKNDLCWEISKESWLRFKIINEKILSPQEKEIVENQYHLVKDLGNLKIYRINDCYYVKSPRYDYEEIDKDFFIKQNMIQLKLNHELVDETYTLLVNHGTYHIYQKDDFLYCLRPAFKQFFKIDKNQYMKNDVVIKIE